ncbi:MAG: substrate-binding protein [Proteobacteria bacterium]|nr:substrate-binding protein [Pseudomonadota bacterium]
MKRSIKLLVSLLLCCALPAVSAISQTVNIGLNYPQTGPYSIEGLDQLRAATLATEEINSKGGILGRKIRLITTDSKSRVDETRRNVTDLFNEGALMVFGGSSSAVAIEAGRIAKQRKKLFFGTLTYSTATTGKHGHRYVFRECYDAWMGAKAIAAHLNKRFSGKKYFYITANYTWGFTTEASVRALTNTIDEDIHKVTKTPFPGAKETDFRKALSIASIETPDVLVLVLFGRDMTTAIQIAKSMGLKERMQIVVPNLTLGMAEGGSAEVMEGVIGALPWTWKIPYLYNHTRGKRFVEDFAAKFDRYPSTSGASAYTILYEYKAAVERAGSFDTEAVIKALEGHTYQLLKDKQTWRDFDHQSIQTVFAVELNPPSVVAKDKFKLDYFKILSSIPGQEAAISKKRWTTFRRIMGRPSHL